MTNAELTACLVLHTSDVAYAERELAKALRADDADMLEDAREYFYQATDNFNNAWADCRAAGAS